MYFDYGSCFLGFGLFKRFLFSVARLEIRFGREKDTVLTSSPSFFFFSFCFLETLKQMHDSTLTISFLLLKEKRKKKELQSLAVNLQIVQHLNLEAFAILTHFLYCIFQDTLHLLNNKITFICHES